MIVKKDICYANTPHDRSYLDIYLPESKIEKVLIYFHGGGIEAGNKGLEQVGKYIGNNIAVVCPNYRLYPNAKFPEFIEDAAQAAAWVKNNPAEVGYCDDIYIGGSSAGGYLSMMLYFDDQYLAKHNLSARDFSGFIHDAGQPTTHYNVLRERGFDGRRVMIDEAAPIYHITEYARKPKMMIIVAERDMVNRFEQTMLLLSTLKHHNYPDSIITYRYMENYGHCGYLKDSVFSDAVIEFLCGQ